MENITLSLLIPGAGIFATVSGRRNQFSCQSLCDYLMLDKRQNLQQTFWKLRLEILTSQRRMRIQVHTVSGRKHHLDVEPNMTIGLVKEEIQQREGIDVSQQRLLLRGENLSNESTIEMASINEGAVMHMVLALRAGH